MCDALGGGGVRGGDGGVGRGVGGGGEGSVDEERGYEGRRLQIMLRMWKTKLHTLGAGISNMNRHYQQQERPWEDGRIEYP